MFGFFERNMKRMVAAAIVVTLWYFTRQPSISDAEREKIASRFSFTEFELAEAPGPPKRTVRAVHPDFEHIAAWISSVGAAVSLSDLDGDGLADDVCYVDTRTDQVIVAPVPGSGARYAPMVLSPHPLPYETETTAPTGCIPGDLNEDGLTDVLVYYWGRAPIAFLQVPRATDAGAPVPLDRTRFVAREIVPGGSRERWYTNAATRADIDGDGHVDLIFGNYFPDGARILDAHAVDRQHMHHSMSRALDGGTNRLLLCVPGDSSGSAGVTFRESTGVWTDAVARGWTLAVAAADLDGDLLPEIYFANDFGNDRLLFNRSTPGKPRFELLEGRRTWTTPRSKTLGQDSFKGMGADFADINGDGLLDLYVSNIATEWGLQESHFAWINTGRIADMRDGVAPFEDQSESLGLARSSWGWESRLADFDNDGVPEAIQATGFVRGEKNRWPQLHEAAMGNDELLRYTSMWHRVEPGDDLCGHDHNPFYVRSASGRFFDLAGQVGLGREQVSRGIATADVDGDGDLDIAIANQWEPSRFYRNDARSAGAFLALRLLLPIGAAEAHAHPEAKANAEGVRVTAGHRVVVSATPAIGAEAVVYLDQDRKLVAQVDGGNGHSGVRSPDLHFGLGAVPSEKKLRVRLRWRDLSGRSHEQDVSLTPGWHTVVLAAPATGDQPVATR